MKTYSERTNKDPDFRIRYELRDGIPPIHQHLRTDVEWVEDNDPHTMWIIWPEYESAVGVPLPEDAPVSPSGTATMWVLNQHPDYRAELRKRVRIGAKGYIWRGVRLADFEVIEVLRLALE